MTKKTKKCKALPQDIRAFPISKKKSFNHNLNAFLKMLQENYTQLSSR